MVPKRRPNRRNHPVLSLFTIKPHTAVIAGTSVYRAPVFNTLVYRKPSNIHQKNATRGKLRKKYLNNELTEGNTNPYLEITNGKTSLQ